MKLNQDKCHLLISGHKCESVWANTGSCKIWESNDQKLLGVNIDCNLKFNHYILKQCKKVGRRLSALTRISKFISLKCRRVLTKSFIESQLAYCPLVWTWSDKISDNRINYLHERALSTVYNDNVSTFEKLLEKNNSARINERNQRILAAELYEIKENLATPIIHENFELGNIQYKLRSQTGIQLGSVKAVNCGWHSDILVQKYGT